jgi:hypothetical protein
MQYRLKVNPFPKGIGEDRRVVAESGAILGANRFKYFKKPITYMPIFNGIIVYQKKPKTVEKKELFEPELPTKSIGVQTMYR